MEKHRPARSESGPGSPAKEAKAHPPKHPEAEAKTPKVEKDQGFNESHGYPPGHGGPTSPGDAPAKAAPTDRELDGGPRGTGSDTDLDRGSLEPNGGGVANDAVNVRS